MDTRTKTTLVSLAFVLFSIILAGLFFLARTDQAVSLTLSYAAGLSMIFLPCTLPLAFIIVPLTMSKGAKKGLIMAILFGIGVSITLSLYGVFMALVGQYLGLDSATRVMFVVAGTAALLFGVSELKFVSWAVPGFSGAIPSFIQRQGEYLRVLAMGLFLGNAGVGCPNPAFYVLLGYIATVGDIGTGWLLGFIHGVGRATPLIFLAILGILGVNATGVLTAKKETVDRLMGWALVGVGGFILAYGLFGMDWWEKSVFHASWNGFIYKVSPALAEVPGHAVPQGILEAPFWAGWVLLAAIISTALFWALKKGQVAAKKALFLILVFASLAFSALSGLTLAEDEHGVEVINREEVQTHD